MGRTTIRAKLPWAMARPTTPFFPPVPCTLLRQVALLHGGAFSLPDADIAVTIEVDSSLGLHEIDAVRDALARHLPPSGGRVRAEVSRLDSRSASPQGRATPLRKDGTADRRFGSRGEGDPRSLGRPPATAGKAATAPASMVPAKSLTDVFTWSSR